MYKLISVMDTIGIPPRKFGDDIKEVSLELLRNRYEGIFDEDHGIILSINAVKEIGEGVVVPGDGSAYYHIVFEALTYLPELQEVVDGRVSEILEFGAFVRIGPIEGLVHVSQLMDEFISYDPQKTMLVAKDSNKMLAVGDIVKSRIVSISLKKMLSESKIGLTMRQPCLGKSEWSGKTALKTASVPSELRVNLRAEIKEQKEGESEEPAAEETVAEKTAEEKPKDSTEAEVKEPVELQEKESAEVKVKESTDVEVKESAEVKVKESTDVEVKEPAEVKVVESVDVGVKEPAEVKVKESTDVGVKESAEVKVVESVDVGVKGPVELQEKEPAEIQNVAEEKDEEQKTKGGEKK
ncbi:MAG: DNA-directed RNA polymerase [Candidatus Diapherotrites archaeon]|nr:DNA-directed RNA polymerase [Candidatus Diapherotrites archaeon]